MIGRSCIGNSRLMFSVSAAFAPPLLMVTNHDSFGVNFVGESQSGKTTLLRCAGSVWGGSKNPSGYLQSWRATANGLEAVAAAHCDCLLCLDEMGQLDAREAGETAYMLANGIGKQRAGRTGAGRKPAEWRLILLSSGEITLADKMMEAGQRPRAGQQVRLIDVPSDAGEGLGVFENLHKYPSARAFAEALRETTQKAYGRPIREYLPRLVAAWNNKRDALVETLKEDRAEFMRKHLPTEASSQVQSVCSHFSLIAAAGNLATSYGITRWPNDGPDWAAGECFKAWVGARGTSGNSEIEDGIRQVRAFIEAHGSSRFEAPWENETLGHENHERIINRVGFRRREGETWQYMILPEMWGREVAKGCNARALARAMVDRKLLIAGNDGKPARLMDVRSHGKLKLYVLAPGIISGDAETKTTDPI